MKLEALAFLTAACLVAAVFTTHNWVFAAGLLGLLLIPGRRQGKPKKARGTSDAS